MINLLPHNLKEEVAREYRLRRIGVILGLLSAALILGCFFLFPSFALTWYKLRSGRVQVENVPKKSFALDFKKEISDIDHLVKMLRAEPSVSPTSVISLVVKHQSAGITITSIAYAHVVEEKIAKVTVVVTGMAKTRSSLATFTDLIGREEGVEKVDVPVSNFAKDANIPFSFTITEKIQ